MNTIDREHTTYEMTMLAGAIAILFRLNGQEPDRFTINAMNIVGYKSAANLYDLLATGWVTPEQRADLDKMAAVRVLIEDQIMTLTPRRTTEMNEKLQGPDMAAMFAMLHKYLDRLNIEDNYYFQALTKAAKIHYDSK